MLDQNALSQLSQLKSDIQASKDYAEGVVSATNGRFGFVRTDDGRDAYLSPEKMDRVLAGDRVKISIETTSEGKLEAHLEKLFSSELSKFVGQYRIKGKGHFVAPLGGKFNRWIFVAPKHRKGTQDGEYVLAKINKHPYADGKAQSSILYRIGKPDDAFIEHKFIKAKYDLNYRSVDAIKSQSEMIATAVETMDDPTRVSYTDTPFFTIDASSTLDMDDALFIEQHSDGFRLLVAIADPASFIAPDSPLAIQAQQAGQSVYLMGGAVPMLPANLAHHTFSLEEGKQRPALVCEMLISNDGEIREFTFKKSLIRSHYKLSYEQVAAFLERGEKSVSDELEPILTRLKTLSEARRRYRRAHHLVSDDHADYDYTLDERGNIFSIAARPRNQAQQIVEEAMVATNMCAGSYLSEKQMGLHAVHKGFREERLGEVMALLKEEGVDIDDVNQLENHLHLIKTLSASAQLSPLVAPLRRMMQAAETSLRSGPHLGLGLKNYAPVTSPIRRFTDLFNHWCLNAALTGEAAPAFSDEALSALNDTNMNARQADRELQQWLSCLFAQTQLGTQARGTIRIVTQQGFGVKIIETGIEGFVLFDRKVEKTFDAKRMTLTLGERCFRIGDEVDITIKSVDTDKRRIAFELADTPATSNEHR